MSLEDLKKTMDPAKYVGRAREQVDAYLKNVIYPLLQENEKELWYESGDQCIIDAVHIKKYYIEMC